MGLRSNATPSSLELELNLLPVLAGLLLPTVLQVSDLRGGGVITVLAGPSLHLTESRIRRGGMIVGNSPLVAGAGPAACTGRAVQESPLPHGCEGGCGGTRQRWLTGHAFDLFENGLPAQMGHM